MNTAKCNHIDILTNKIVSILEHPINISDSLLLLANRRIDKFKITLKKHNIKSLI